MVQFKANLAFDYRQADLYAGYESADFLKDSSKPGHMFYVYTSETTAITVTGKNFTYTDDDIPISGVTQSATLFFLSPQGQYIPAYSLSKFSISISEAFDFIQKPPLKVLQEVFEGNDTIEGSRYADHINGFKGQDKLTGGDKADVFYFTYKETSANRDIINDFHHNQDKIAIDDAIFKGISKNNKNDVFCDLSKSQPDRNDKLLYDRDTGILSYDKDGRGGAPAVKIAVLNWDNPTNNQKFDHPVFDPGDLLIV